MGPSCPNCGKSEFRYRALLSVHPSPGEMSPTLITCPSCGSNLRVTAKSRLLGAATFLSLVIASAMLLATLPMTLMEWQFLTAILSVMAAYYFAIWPLIVRLKPWSEFQYWLPKSRLVGYSVYLLLPLGIMALALYLAVKFKVGM